MCMEISVTYQGSKRNISFPGRTARDLLKELGILPETVLVARNGEIVPESEALAGGDRIELLRVISGG